MISNVIRKEHEVRGGKVFSEPDKRIYPLIERIAQDYPHVKFEEAPYSSDYAYGGNINEPKCYIREYNVLDNGEHVGTIGFRSWGKFAYELSNERIRKDMERGSTKRTADIEKAMKIYKKYFYRSTIKEQVVAAVNMGTRMLDRFHDVKRGELNRGWRKIEDSMKAFLLANIDSFNKFSGTTDLNKVREDMEISTSATDMYNRFMSGQAFMFSIVGDKYVAARRNGSNELKYKELTRDEMKPYDLQTIGMLKLLQVDQAILNKGYKVSDSCFIVFPETEGDIEPNIVMESIDELF